MQVSQAFLILAKLKVINLLKKNYKGKNMKASSLIKNHLKDSIKTKQAMLETCVDDIKAAALAIVDCFYKDGGTVYTFGNGGSAADAQHISDELLCMLRTNNDFENRFPLPAHALTTDVSVLTAIANDLGFDHIFSRQLEALAKPGDLIIGISTSGNSKNVVKAIKLAKSRGIKTIGMTGKKGGELKKICDICIAIPRDDVAHIQEGHESAFHVMCDIMEQILFSSKGLSRE
jgi:D-sedoheptulose 7-phosphate isomerase